MAVTRLAFILVFVAVAAAGCSAAAASASAPQSWSGAHSGIEAPATRVVRDAAGWETLWKDLGREPPRPLDTSREMAVAMFLGQRPTAGYRIEFVSAREAAGQLAVTYRERTPARDKQVAQVLTTPWAVIILPASDLPVSTRAATGRP